MDTVAFIKTLESFGLEWFRRYYSVYRAKVADNDDPQKRGRIKIAVPFLGVSPLEEWAIPISQYAGKSYGSFFPPEKGDYVWVMFENGNAAFPLYLGGWWAKDEVPEGFSITRRGIRTKNCEMYFDDKDKIIKIKTPAATLTLDDAAKKVTVEIGGESVTLDSDAKQVTVKADTKVSVEASSVLVKSGDIKLGSDGASKNVLLDQDKHICVITGAPVPTVSTATKTKAE